jgi:hypothetical protein
VIVVPFLADKNRPVEISGAFLAGMKDIENANTEGRNEFRSGYYH